MDTAQLPHDFGMKTGAVQGPGPSDIQAQLGQVRPDLLSDVDPSFQGVGEPGIKLLVPGKIVLQVKTVIPGRFSHRCESVVILAFQVAPGDVQPVQAPLHSQVHELKQINLLGPGIGLDAPVLTQSPQMKGIGMKSEFHFFFHDMPPAGFCSVNVNSLYNKTFQVSNDHASTLSVLIRKPDGVLFQTIASRASCRVFTREDQIIFIP
jgi:hypothetical protein